jgi:hypothetical protein
MGLANVVCSFPSTDGWSAEHARRAAVAATHTRLRAVADNAFPHQLRITQIIQPSASMFKSHAMKARGMEGSATGRRVLGSWELSVHQACVDVLVPHASGLC